MNTDNLTELMEILSYRRPDRSASMREMTANHVATLGATPDAEGNYCLDIGLNPSILWSAHLDTVHREQGRQRVALVGGKILTVANRKGNRPNCLGADDGLGVWLLCEMVRSGVAGRYVWHVGEECGSRGSRSIAKSADTRLQGIQIAMAFDRRGTNSVITHQGWSRCCSNAFAQSFASALGVAGLPGYLPDDTGVFTDTANYVDHIAECSNLSVGYFDEHRQGEHADASHILKLRDALCTMDASSLVVERDASVTDTGWDDVESFWERRYDRKTQKVVICAVTDDIPEGNHIWIEDDNTETFHAIRADWERTGKTLCGEIIDAENDGSGGYNRWWTNESTYIPSHFCGSCHDIADWQTERDYEK